MTLLYGVHLSWDTIAPETTLLFFKGGEENPVHTETTTDDYYRLETSNENNWFTKISDETEIIVQVAIIFINLNSALEIVPQINDQAGKRREADNSNSSSTVFAFTKKGKYKGTLRPSKLESFFPNMLLNYTNLFF